eukprot:1970660-Pleurochrysis_carterae.AAC.1
MSLGAGETSLLRQLSLQLGCGGGGGSSAGSGGGGGVGGGGGGGVSGVDAVRLARLFSGDDATLLELFPELGVLRDACFLFKAAMAPSLASLPAKQAWTADDARLEWR